MTGIETWISRLFLFLAGISLPVCLFFPNSPNITFTGLGLISLGLLVLRKELNNLIPPIKAMAPLLLFTLWGLLGCLWSDTPYPSFLTVDKILLAVLAAASFYAVQTTKLNEQFTKWFRTGYDVALFLLILDEILNTRILRSLRGPEMETPEYYHGVTLLVLSLWPILNVLKNRHGAVKALLIALLLIGVFEMTDHAAKLALILGLVSCAITYINPRLFLRVAGVLSVVIMMAFPFAIKDMDPVKVIKENEFILIKQSYYHRLFILKRTTNMIFEKPWFGHGLETYRSTMNKDIKSLDVAIELEKIMKGDMNTPYNLDIVGQTTHPHNISLQIWLELGVVGVLLFAFFLLSSLWRLSGIKDRRYELSAFMGLYTSMFTIAHISFGAWQTWWLFSVAIILSLSLWQILKDNRQ